MRFQRKSSSPWPHSTQLIPHRLMMCQSAEDLRNQAQWDGARGDSRMHLLSDLSSEQYMTNLDTPTNMQKDQYHPVL